nr:hypothetical protein [uncultured Desulfobacter sp.]
MSYDIYLYAPIPGKDHTDTIDYYLNGEEEDINPGPPDEASEAKKKRIANSLISFNNDFEIFCFGFDEIAKIENISIEDAKIKYRHLEINESDDGNGIQITVYDNSATVTVPYWHTGETAKEIFEKIFEYLQIIQEESGYIIYDPQIESIIDLNEHCEVLLNKYASVSTDVQDGGFVDKLKEKSPWWKFWK